MTAAFECQLCDSTDCDAAFVVSVPTDASHASDPELNVGRDCRDDAIRYLEGQPFAAGLAQVDPIHHGGA